jgi:hypothetical protein
MGRMLAAAFGLFLLGVGGYVLAFSEAAVLWRLIGGGLLAVLGGNLLYAAYKDKPSWLSKVGPLP